MHGGIALYPNRNQEICYEWGLGMLLNNLAEALTFYQGIKILDADHIEKVIVVGDSLIIIKFMRCLSIPSSNTLKWLVKRIQNEARRFEYVEYYHVLWENNRQWDCHANSASSLNSGQESYCSWGLTDYNQVYEMSNPLATHWSNSLPCKCSL